MKPAAILKWAGIVVGVVVLLFAALLAYVAFIFDANAYKGRIIQFVADKYQRTLTIDGDLRLSVFPSIAVALPHTSLSDPRAKSIAAEVGAVRVSLELWPLLHKEVRVGEVALDGLKAAYVKGKDGKSNFDDFLGGESGAAKPSEGAKPKGESGAAAAPSIDVGGIRVTNSAVAYRDQASGNDIALSQIDLKVGRLADKSAVPLDLSVRIDGKQPAIAGVLGVHGKALLDLGAHRYGADTLKADFNGTFAGTPLTAQVELPQLDWTPEHFAANALKIAVKRGGADAMDATLSLDGASGSPAAVDVKQLGLVAHLASQKPARTIAFEMHTPLAANLDAQSVTLAKLDGRVKVDDASMPIKAIEVPFGGRVAVNAKAEKADGNLDAKFDESTIAAKFGVAGFAKPAINFDVTIDRINVDRYVSFAPSGAAAPSAPGASATAPAKEEPFDLSPLKTLALDGAARIGNLQVHGIKAANISIKLAAHGGDLRVAPIAAQLYGGAIDATARVDANTNRFAFAPKLTGIQIGPLLRDGIQLDKLEGSGNVSADVNAAGNTVTALKRSLAGNASVRLVDGAIKGFDYAKHLSDWKTKLSSLGSGARNEGASSSADEKTMFSELSANFAIANGVATNNDLAVKAPLVRLAGAGSIDIGHDNLDYTVKGSVVNTLTGQGGKEIGQAKDITIPVRVHGPYDKIAYEIQWAAVSSSMLKSTVGAKVEEQKKQLQDKAKDQLKDKLKGLLSR